MGDGIRSRYFRALSKVDNPPFDSENPHFRSKFASLSVTLKVIREACEGEGLAYWHHLIWFESGNVALQSGLMSEDGEELKLSLTPMTNNPDAQKFGAELTYKRRQTAQADFGITGEVDDDGETAAGRTPKRDYSAIAPLKRRYMAAKGIDETKASNELVAALGNPARLSNDDYRRYLQKMEALVREAEHGE